MARLAASAASICRPTAALAWASSSAWASRSRWKSMRRTWSGMTTATGSPNWSSGRLRAARAASSMRHRPGRKSGSAAMASIRARTGRRRKISRPNGRLMRRKKLRRETTAASSGPSPRMRPGRPGWSSKAAAMSEPRASGPIRSAHAGRSARVESGVRPDRFASRKARPQAWTNRGIRTGEESDPDRNGRHGFHSRKGGRRLPARGGFGERPASAGRGFPWSGAADPSRWGFSPANPRPADAGRSPKPMPRP